MTTKIRLATDSDIDQIKKVLSEADLRFTQETLNGFCVAEINGEIIGLVRLEEHDDFLFLTSLGVATAHQHKGIASELMNSIISKAKKPIYLYTIIPAFFIRFGFKPVSQPYPQQLNLPPKGIYGCDKCVPGHCLTMVKCPGDTKVS
ncbi:MAG: GNAT family N-acetyltransferase [Candidatus Margulisbacteria bacterium]|nr:GNAT family N-acetyltransferase [Candidatus Margulisiibacteriota bacterium]